VFGAPQQGFKALPVGLGADPGVGLRDQEPRGALAGEGRGRVPFGGNLLFIGMPERQIVVVDALLGVNMKTVEEATVFKKTEISSFLFELLSSTGHPPFSSK
jgi:hypothetical protein